MSQNGGSDQPDPTVNQEDDEASLELTLSLSLTARYRNPSAPESPSPSPTPPQPPSVSVPITLNSAAPPPQLHPRYHNPSAPESPFPTPPQQPSVSVPITLNNTAPPPPQLQPRIQKRGPRSQGVRPGKSEEITPQYPWAQARRASIHNLNYLHSKGISKISGKVQCKGCEREYEKEYDLKEKLMEISRFIREKGEMHDRAPDEWINSRFEDCESCGQKNSLRPILGKKKFINWLFLFLGQMVGVCKLKILKYFCKHKKIHRTGARNRLLYKTYKSLCEQLDQNWVI